MSDDYDEDPVRTARAILWHAVAGALVWTAAILIITLLW
jgi:hypothetical protein